MGVFLTNKHSHT